MKLRSLFWYACLFPGFAQAEQLSLNLQSVPLAQFVHATYKSILKRDFVLSPDVVALQKPITVSIQSIDSSEFPKFVDSVLAKHGVTGTFSQGVYYLSVASSEITDSTAGTPIVLSGASAKRGVVAADSRLTEIADSTTFPSQSKPPSLRREVVLPKHRRSDALVAALNGVFETKVAFDASGIVVLSTTEENMPSVLEIAERLDRDVKKVRLSATFVEVSSTEANSLGISLVAEVLGLKLGVKLGDASGSTLNLKTKNFQAVIDALSSDGRFRQVAAPTAVVNENERSSISFGDSVPTIAGTSIDKNGNAIQQIQYQQSGVILDVLPAVLADNQIHVILDGQVSAFSATTTGVSGSPTLSKRHVKTAVTMADGELLVIGGLNSNKTVENSTGLSFLPKRFAMRGASSASTDLVLILCATVVQ